MEFGFFWFSIAIVLEIKKCIIYLQHFFHQFLKPIRMEFLLLVVTWLGTLTTSTKSGIFPWFEDGEPIIWWSPNPGFYWMNWLFLKHEKYFEQKYFKITFNQNFRDVISNCQNIKREVKTVLGLQMTWSKPIVNFTIRYSKISWGLAKTS
jgi:hypothetical protein